MSPWKKFGFLGSYSIPLIILLGYYLPAEPITFITAPYAYILVPLFDYFLGEDRNNVLKKDFDSLLGQNFFDFLVYSHIYIQFGLLAWGSYVLSTVDLSTSQIVGIFVSQGLYGATIINVSHELGHRKSSLARMHAKAGLISVFYFHFMIEHNRGHHSHVATPNDPATSRKGQNLFAFWKQSLIGTFKSAWQINKRLLAKNGKATWSLSNEMIWGTMAPVLLCVLLFFGFSWFTGFAQWVVIKFFFIQSILAILLLESVNYIEHYGMLRRKLSSGSYEKVNPLHSWNANHFYSNLLLFNLQRHSDHHAYAARPYQVLRHFDQSPQLPFGYPLMILMALCPPLWFSIMNKKLEGWEENAYDADTIKRIVKEYD